MNFGEVAAETRAAPRKKKPAQPHPWSYEETAHLIDVYEEMWYALKRCPFKVHQWEEVAVAVTDRLGLAVPAKSGTQCRHKMEKLRWRYRSELQRAAPSRWLLFDRIDRLERGPFPISALPPPPISASDESEDERENEDGADEEEEEDGDDEDDSGAGRDEEDEDDGINGGTRGINGSFRKCDWRFPRVSGNHRFGEYDEREAKGRAARELVEVTRRLGEGFMRMEKRRLELAREMEKDWMEVEVKRAKMVMESQRCLVNCIVQSFCNSANKKPKKVVKT